jgi:phage terminase large subunit-like protein
MGRAPDNRYYILDVTAVPEAGRRADRGDRRHGAPRPAGRGQVKVYVERPPGLAKEPTEDTIRALAGFPAEATRSTRTRRPRRAVSAQCPRRQRPHARRRLEHGYLAMMCGFPTAAHDDDVDASSGAFNKLADAGPSLWRGPSLARRR